MLICLKMIKAAITGLAAFVPEDRITNKDLEELVETNDQWIQERTGIVERRVLRKENTGASYLGSEAAKKLILKNNIDPQTIDAIICTTVTPDHNFPPTSSKISRNINAGNAFAFDVNATCAGFIYALEVASKFIESGKYKKIMIVSAENMTSITDYQDRSSCILFGDAAGAILLEPSNCEYGVEDIVLKTDGSEAEKIIVRGGGSYMPFSQEVLDNRLHYFFQEGKSVFKRAVMGMESACKEVLDRNNLSLNEVDYLIPHQANKRIIDTIAKRLSIPTEKLVVNIEKYGNTSSASIPLCLAEFQTKFNKGDKIVLTAFGSGYSWGATLITWSI